MAREPEVMIQRKSDTVDRKMKNSNFYLTRNIVQNDDEKMFSNRLHILQ